VPKGRQTSENEPTATNVPRSEDYGISSGAWEKFDDSLRREVVDVGGNPDRELRVMILLTDDHEPTQAATGTRIRGEERAMFVADQGDSFERRIDGLLRELEALKARDIKTFWLNRTISAMLPVRALDEIGRRADVKQMILVRKQKVMA